MAGRVGFEGRGGRRNQLGSGFAVAGQGKGGRQDPAGLRMHGILFHAIHGGVIRIARQGQRVEPVGLVHVREELAGRHAISFAEALLGTFPTGENVGIHRESLGGRLGEEGSAHGRDPCVNGAVGPVGEAAARLLAGVQPGNDIGNGCRCLPGLFLAQQGHQVQEREAFGGQLLGAVVGIVQHCPGQGAGVEGRIGGKGQLSRTREGKLPSGRQGMTLYHNGFPFITFNRYHEFLGTLARSADGRYRQMGRTLSGGFQPEPGHLVARLGETEGLGCLVQDADRSFRLYAQVYLARTLFHGKDIDGQGDLVSAAQQGRQGREDHQRGGDGRGFPGRPPGILAGGHHHDAHASHIHRQGDPVLDALSFGHGNRTDETDHRVEAVVLAGGHEVVLVAADGRLWRQNAVQGTDDVIVHVPGLDAQGLIAIHLGPRVGRFESRQIQQALVHDGQGIGHGPALFLADLQGKRFLRMQFVGQGQYRLQV